MADSRAKLPGKDCMAANIILGVDKQRYNDGKGDPRGFIDFIEKHHLPKGLVPRYRGNRSLKYYLVIINTNNIHSSYIISLTYFTSSII